MGFEEHEKSQLQTERCAAEPLCHIRVLLTSHRKSDSVCLTRWLRRVSTASLFVFLVETARTWIRGIIGMKSNIWKGRFSLELHQKSATINSQSPSHPFRPAPLPPPHFSLPPQHSGCFSCWAGNNLWSKPRFSAQFSHSFDRDWKVADELRTRAKNYAVFQISPRPHSMLITLRGAVEHFVSGHHCAGGGGILPEDGMSRSSEKTSSVPAVLQLIVNENNMTI